MIRIICNGTDSLIKENETLMNYLQNENIATQNGIAVAVNETVIPKQNWEETILNKDDSVLIIKATQGG